MVRKSISRRLPERSYGKCHYCKVKGRMTWDHVIPKSLGGPLKWWNIVLACGECNRAKADTLPTCICNFCTEAKSMWRRMTRIQKLGVIKTSTYCRACGEITMTPDDCPWCFGTGWVKTVDG